MNNKKWPWLLLIILMVSASYFYPKFMSYWGFFFVPVLKFIFSMGIKGLMVTPIVIISMNFVGALIFASLLALPLGYITKERSVLFGFLLAIGLLLYMLWLYVYLYQQTWPTTDVTIVILCEHLGIVLAFIIMAKAGARVRCYQERKST